MVCRDVEGLSRRAAEQFVALAQQSIVVRGRFAVALSGGSTPRALYSLLATSEFSGQLDWRKIQLFFGDERCVPPDHGESNYRMVQQSLLAKIVIPRENVHRMLGEIEPAKAAATYEDEIRKTFALTANQLPRFDLIFLGLGDDGHTASLFPASSALRETQALVASTYVEKFQAHRLTLTLPTINNAAQITFLIAGQTKAAVVKAILAGQGNEAPAARVQPTEGELTWLITADAAGDFGNS